MEGVGVVGAAAALRRGQLLAEHDVIVRRRWGSDLAVVNETTNYLVPSSRGFVDWGCLRPPGGGRRVRPWQLALCARPVGPRGRPARPGPGGCFSQGRPRRCSPDLDISLDLIAKQANQFKILQDRFRQAWRVGALGDLAEFQAEFDTRMSEMDALRSSSLPPPERFFKRAQTKVQSGDYSFEADPGSAG